ncbi:membrane magnesium transporter, putative [Plasmodium chabaudi adami]|uniref:Membrane magnesium transporter, putative n=1 Tax=Plasmodium chabaudi adami TaxID=5826 RepID=A0A1D3LG01_PLACE|nr:membrane magnesium transporter, putative [Plasmodium chabaudi adami]
MMKHFSVMITLIGLSSLLKCGHNVYLLLNAFKLGKDSIEDFTIPTPLTIQTILCALITIYGGSKLFLSFKKVEDMPKYFDNKSWDATHVRKSFRLSYNRKFFIKDYINDFLTKNV